MIVRFNGRTPQPQNFRLANQGNNKVDKVQFELPPFDGATAFLHINIGAYSDVVQLVDGTYVATRTHTQRAGRIGAWVEILANGELVWRSDVFYMTVGHIPDDSKTIEKAYPTAIEEALRAVDTLTGVGARAETLPPDSAATVSLEEDAAGNRIIVYGIPRGYNGPAGADGEKGEKGDTGEKGEKGDAGEQGPQGEQGPAGADGAQGPEGPQGPQGETGPAGAAGYTPVRGTDYWTEADQQAIVDAVLANFVDASEVAM